MKLVTVAGTRPEIIKLANLVPLLNNNFDHKFVYTGQHYSPNMSDIFIDELKIQPDYDLQSNTSDIDVIKEKMLPILKQLQPNWVVVYGDTNSSMAAALAASEIGSKIIHVEAGVRDFDSHVPEEPLRIRIDEMSEYLFSPSSFCTTVLSYENIKGKVFTSGNLVVDVCKNLSKIASDKPLPQSIPNEFLLLTLHRPENVDNPRNLELLMNHMRSTVRNIVFPVHPRTKKNLQKYGIKVPPNVHLIDPLGYLEFLSLMLKSNLILTDSGGIQEESITIKKPCITLRHTSARWETILLGSNILFPPDREDSLDDVIMKMIDKKVFKNPYGENVADKIIEVLKNELK
ncbi:MAG: non-hydrolyzing UDP-N-acetylglucosamine 2-epimerase [Candidatus Nitrosocosmicus sp.]|jgi:UDP-N-acetylglucosamine 2-epimerase|uniref:non-hydrolyzing UDP-N-acetylglucosamine 2-epimerase n=1 Tax=Candidatus Nitrosocosmicus agrestis TaxID=2563600 RepID=UPI00122DCE3C|nr:UDP-N-acetylglucosamine 2-epimerase (non-hydrolyzing) [Candidatus Nitrosocosmicus sp. SS]KAA2283420.1 UDP-N-acetylglucosamine 2-epimerase (non-hydrolyzing) [Candidatus Nitrosocosmicus sp. SS]KAF0868933.1 UDP-N-acetylglucosamine 2-epimerase (non-hydrolyzing) [Candidatus Nitrosocosmicus sp. SS]